MKRQDKQSLLKIISVISLILMIILIEISLYFKSIIFLFIGIIQFCLIGPTSIFLSFIYISEKENKQYIQNLEKGYKTKSILKIMIYMIIYMIIRIIFKTVLKN